MYYITSSGDSGLLTCSAPCKTGQWYDPAMEVCTACTPQETIQASHNYGWWVHGGWWV